jgi:hypothetical protein
MSNRFPVLALVLGLVACNDGQSAKMDPSVTTKAQNVSGAIFTTLSDGATVNANNQYEDRCDVYLNGGPAPGGAAGLDPGNYYFQVTDPSGMTLLSTDAVTNREVTVDATGRFTGTTGTHLTSNNTVDGGVTVQLCPYDFTPNNGCVYKVWITPVEDYDPTARNGNFGFVEGHVKFDNFRLCEEAPDAGVPDAAPPGPDAAPPSPDAAPPSPDAAPQPDAEEESPSDQQED